MRRVMNSNSNCRHHLDSRLHHHGNAEASLVPRRRRAGCLGSDLHFRESNNATGLGSQPFLTPLCALETGSAPHRKAPGSRPHWRSALTLSLYRTQSHVTRITPDTPSTHQPFRQAAPEDCLLQVDSNYRMTPCSTKQAERKPLFSSPHDTMADTALERRVIMPAVISSGSQSHSGGASGSRASRRRYGVCAASIKAAAWLMSAVGGDAGSRLVLEPANQDLP
ncbi:hypothetical protein SKAU_G00419170 [Synaphobranchus kaupii]|uniref:Uncharacterized protein n=1 Tax=Synaphobranchus kaupii TaxID=118154 RepID=A0A9Q1E6C1_SYNKA|nr:hypothetical protein SKAU_G00419170 [Synaphobranchus kaupii]